MEDEENQKRDPYNPNHNRTYNNHNNSIDLGSHFPHSKHDQIEQKSPYAEHDPYQK